LLNEKTLELNITHELLETYRMFDRKAFALGTTLNEEGKNGYDSRILGRYPHFWSVSPLQYKKAKRRYPVGRNQFSYVFEINNNRHNDQQIILFYTLAGGMKNVAFYALPAIYTQTEFSSSLPHLLNRTYYVDVSEIKPSWVNRRRHQIHLNPQQKIAFLHSKERQKIEVMSSEELMGVLAERQIGINISTLLENMKQPVQKEFKNLSKRPRFLFSIFPR
jgi:hypothetical protein